ncbi:MAG: hypothetical protein ACK4KW_01955 [Gemmobacter sp.]
MTALDRYQRLETTGLWRPAPDQRRREVVVALGEASLTLSDAPSETPLAAWSLPALVRLNPGRRPAVYAPGSEPGAETLELEDPAMIEAIETVRRAVGRATTRPGRLRRVLLVGSVLAAAGALALWFPGALHEHAATVVPMPARVEIGRAALDDVIRTTGAPCNAVSARPALVRFTERLLGASGGEIRVMRQGVPGAAHLPGRIVLIDRRLIEDQDSPDAAAGFVLAERLRAERRDPLVPLLRAAGVAATLRLLASGSLGAEAVAGYGRMLLAAPAEPLPPDAILRRFAEAGLAATPYALAVDPTGAATRALIDGDPGATRPIMSDNDWIALQSICAE